MACKWGLGWLMSEWEQKKMGGSWSSIQFGSGWEEKEKDLL